jgi:hypothetical protein
MDDDQAKQNNLVETTDCLEAVGVFRGWKNFFFITVVVCLVLLQICFWLASAGHVKAEDSTEGSKPIVCDNEEQVGDANEAAGEPNQPAEGLSKDPNQPVEEAVQEGKQGGSLFGIRFKHLAWFIRFVNFVVVPAAVLYCLTILFTLKVSLLGRLGGINHICRAFFLSLVMVVLLLPWQQVFDGVVGGVVYTADELAGSCAAERCGIFASVLYYLRFVGYWVLVMALLVLSQLRSSRWTKATLRRLEVI